ncbi:MAG: phosphoenolpyruvate carboxykinase (ATP), partial [Gemmatimonadetes bacterium]|nr:phosphoenolpyruvate carboxykinase (ATP) [Gemmatimonadota bacterium]
MVDEPTSNSSIWWGSVTQRMTEEHFDGLHKRVIDHYRGRRLYARDMFAGADAATRIPIRVVNETAWHNLFAAQLFIKPASLGLQAEDPQFTVLNAPTCNADPSVDGTNSKTFIAVHFGKRLILIGGTAYAGEIKKSIFT